VESLIPSITVQRRLLDLGVLGRRTAEISGGCRKGSFLFQQLSVLIQRYNNVSFIDEEAGTGIPDNIHSVN